MPQIKKRGKGERDGSCDVVGADSIRPRAIDPPRGLVPLRSTGVSAPTNSTEDFLTTLKGGVSPPRLYIQSFFLALRVRKNTSRPVSVPIGRAQQGEKGVYGGKPVSPVKFLTSCTLAHRPQRCPLHHRNDAWRGLRWFSRVRRGSTAYPPPRLPPNPAPCRE